ncbi:MAG: polysaccharide biosynthesis/export family protein [Gemmataceae bacterium]|nr:polysaccharide biosynthesis/export family protein [Gemmataceae bacterium]
MFPRRVWLPGILLAGVALSGCQSSSPTFSRPGGLLGFGLTENFKPGGFRLAKQPTPKLRPGTELQWSLQTAADKPGVVKTGQTTVGPDGSVVFGPYGTLQLGGMDLAQATTAVEKQITSFVPGARVRLTATLPVSSQDLAWRPIGGSPIAKGSPFAPRPDNAKSGPFAPRLDNAKNGPFAPRMDKGGLFAPRVDKSGSEPPKLPAGKIVPTKGEVVPAVPQQGARLPIITDHDAQKNPVVGVGHRQDCVEPVYHQARSKNHYGAFLAKPVELGHPHGRKTHDGMQYAALAPGEMNPVQLPPYIIGPPDVLNVESLKGLITQPIKGPHLVRPDGSIGLGIYGSAQVAGLTIEDAKKSIAKVIAAKLTLKLEEVFDNLSVDVLAYNSKVYYLIADGAGFQPDQILRLPVTGNEFVLDAVSQIRDGLPVVSSKQHIWVARRNPNGGSDMILPVDWTGITQRGHTATNYQLLPGDRVYIRADRWRSFDSALAKVLQPFERLLGITLLGSQTANSLRTGQTGFR